MESRGNIESLLQTGYFTTSRAARSSNPPSPQDEPPAAYPAPRPRREIPRYMPRPPPPPTVEDEADSLLKEHGSSISSSVDETPSRGQVDQYPIIEDVHEHNPERRFVMLPGSDEPEETSRPKKRSQERENDDGFSSDTPNGDYEANTTRKYDTLAPDNVDEVPRPRVGVERRKSRQDLPKIDTDLSREPPPPRAHGHQRSRSSVREDRPPPGYSLRSDKRVSPAHEDLLSPKIIKHATGGRDKAYYDYSRGKQKPLRAERSRSDLSGDRRADDGYVRPSQSMSPGATRRSPSKADSPSSAYTYSYERSPRYREEPGRRRERRNSTYRRESPERERIRDDRGVRNGSNSSGDHSLKAPSSNTRRRRSTVIHDDRPYLQTSAREQPYADSSRSRSRAPASPVPIPSPKLTGASWNSDYPPSPRASGTYLPTKRDGRLGPSVPYPEDDMAANNGPSSFKERDRRASRSSSRAPPNFTQSSTMPVMMPTFPETADPIDGRRSPAPSVPEARASAPQFASSQDNTWPPAPFDPSRNGLAVDKPTGALRRYSEEVHNGGGGFPTIPDCPRRKGVVGKADWLGLPRCDNFAICPSCYTAVFSETAFRNEFMPMPLRPSEKPVSCDFGSSPWYRIAFLLTLKNGQSDLRLFHQIANVAAMSNTQPCPGDRNMVRIWYSIRDPYKQSTLPDFTVCYECAKTVEVLLPNLTGTFVPLHATSAPSRSSCALHFHADRKRFVLYFDALETTSDRALANTAAPNLTALAETIERLSLFAECREDRPVPDQNWHVMQYLPEFTVCGECFDDVVRPKLKDGGGWGDRGSGSGSGYEGGVVAPDFYVKPHRRSLAACQLYSRRMRDVFNEACRRNDPKYLEDKVLARLKVEMDIHAKLERLDQYRQGGRDEWTEKEIESLISEWKKWE